MFPLSTAVLVVVGVANSARAFTVRHKRLQAGTEDGPQILLEPVDTGRHVLILRPRLRTALDAGPCYVVLGPSIGPCPSSQEPRTRIESACIFVSSTLAASAAAPDSPACLAG